MEKSIHKKKERLEKAKYWNSKYD